MNTQFYLQNLLGPIVDWGMDNGVDYKEMVQLLQPLYLQSAKNTLERTQKKAEPTTVELSNVSGMSNADVEALVRAGAKRAGKAEIRSVQGVSYVSQVVASWLAKGLPQSLPIELAEPSASDIPESFGELVRQTAKKGNWADDCDVASIVQGMANRGLIVVQDDHVVLGQAVGEDAIDEDRIAHFAGAIGDHMKACVENLKSSVFLEQSINVDELTSDAAWELNREVNQWWRSSTRHLVARATEIDAACAEEAVENRVHRLRLGIYVYTDAKRPVEPTDAANQQGADKASSAGQDDE
jgi:hypothetical protein